MGSAAWKTQKAKTHKYQQHSIPWPSGLNSLWLDKSDNGAEHASSLCSKRALHRVLQAVCWKSALAVGITSLWDAEGCGCCREPSGGTSMSTSLTRATPLRLAGLRLSAETLLRCWGRTPFLGWHRTSRCPLPSEPFSTQFQLQ